MENFTRDGVISHNIHWNGYGKDLPGERLRAGATARAGDGYHTFGLDWSPKEYVFYTDGKVTWRVDGPISHREQFILISTECNGYRQGGPAPELKKSEAARLLCRRLRAGVRPGLRAQPVGGEG